MYLFRPGISGVLGSGGLGPVRMKDCTACSATACMCKAMLLVIARDLVAIEKRYTKTLNR
jgi:hypothetical protein